MQREIKSTYLVPSESRVDTLIGAQIKDIVKCSFETYEEYKEYLEACSIVGFDDRESFFKYGDGVLLIVFNEMEVSFTSAEDLNSIILRFEKIANEVDEKYILNDDDVLDKTSILDIEEDSDLINQKIMSIEILSRNDLSAKEQGLPSELGVRFNLSNDKSFILSHNLTQNSFVFSFLVESDKLPDELITKQKVTSCF